MKTTLKIAAFALTSLGLAVFAQAVPAGKGAHGMSYHRVDSPKSDGTRLNGTNCCAKCESPKGAPSAKQVRIDGKKHASGKRA